MNFSVVIPTYNGGKTWEQCAQSIVSQTIKPLSVLVIDSSSKDNTVTIAKEHNFDVVVISPSEFNHGGTRNLALKYIKDAEFIIYLTQDAILASNESFFGILNYFQDPSIAAVCGRQIPHDDANPIAIHARKFNYPSVSQIKKRSDIPMLGIKAAFMSNSFAAYRRSIFDFVGRFPNNVILGEDMYVAAKMILSDSSIAYAADAVVKHSHNYSPWQEFKRYFDTGVMHASQHWIIDSFGGASGEGKKFILSELKFLLQFSPSTIPRAFVTNFCKFMGYKIGLNYKKLPWRLCVCFSMYKSFWSQNK